MAIEPVLSSAMNRATHREIAPTIVLDRSGRLLLQKRDNIPGIICPGMIGLFGGHREGNETFLECAARELAEELSFAIPTDHFEALTFNIGPDPEAVGGTLHAEFFLVKDIPVEQVVVTEGSLLIASRSDLEIIADQLTPSAKFALDHYCLRPAITPTPQRK